MGALAPFCSPNAAVTLLKLNVLLLVLTRDSIATSVGSGPIPPMLALRAAARVTRSPLQLAWPAAEAAAAALASWSLQVARVVPAAAGWALLLPAAAAAAAGAAAGVGWSLEVAARPLLAPPRFVPGPQRVAQGLRW